MMHKLLRASLLLSFVTAPVCMFAEQPCHRTEICKEDPEYRKKNKDFCKLTVRECLRVIGNETINGTLTVAGATTLSSLTVTGNETIGGTLTVGGIPFGSLLGYGYASTLAGSVVLNGADVPFTTLAPAFNETLSGTNVSLPAGTYAFYYKVSALGSTPASPLVFQLFNVTAGAAIANSQYNSDTNLNAPAGGNYTVGGIGIFTIGTTSTISLRNFTTGTSVTLTPQNGAGSSLTSVTAGLVLLRIA